MHYPQKKERKQQAFVVQWLSRQVDIQEDAHLSILESRKLILAIMFSGFGADFSNHPKRWRRQKILASNQFQVGQALALTFLHPLSHHHVTF